MLLANTLLSYIQSAQLVVLVCIVAMELQYVLEYTKNEPVECVATVVVNGVTLPRYQRAKLVRQLLVGQTQQRIMALMLVGVTLQDALVMRAN